MFTPFRGGEVLVLVVGRAEAGQSLSNTRSKAVMNEWLNMVDVE